MGSTKLLITIIDWRNSTSNQRTKTQISIMLAFRFIPGMSGMDVKQIVLELRIKGLPLAKLVLLDSGILPSLPHGWQWPWVPSNWQWNQDCSGQLVEKGLSSLPSAEKWGLPCIDEVLTGETSAPTTALSKLLLMANVILLGAVWKQNNHKLHCVGSWVSNLPV